MKNLLVLGGGSAGTMVVNKLRKKLPKDLWEITVIDQDQEHIYQPGLLLLPFGTYEPAQLVKKRESFFPKDVDFIQAQIERVDPTINKVFLDDGREVNYD
ncbi:MAG: NAD(P)/FAD-dependent oxidoreductase, partial [Actinobacteria bacterium]|nr:NAD(P)/FAD-dependent oxidoreductase [Actinomycetota bacterium]